MINYFVSISLVLLTLTGCELHFDSEKIKGSGKFITVQRPVSAFTSIENNSFFQVIVTSGDKDELEITGDDNLVPEVETVVEEQRLIIRNKNKAYSFTWKNNPGTIKISAAHLQSVENGGSGDIELRGIDTDKLALKSYSSGDIKASGKVQSLNLINNGSGDVDLGHLSVNQAEIDMNSSGDVGMNSIQQALKLKLNGSGDFHADGLQESAVNLLLQGSGKVKLRGLVKELKAETDGSGDLDIEGIKVSDASLQLNGSGDVSLSGEAETLTITVNGSGDVEAKDLHTKTVVLKNQGPADLRFNIDQNLKAELSGSGDLKVTFNNANKIELLMNGPGNSSLSGTADNLSAKVNGSGDLNAHDLLLRSASIKVTGPSEAEVNVKQANGSRVVRIDRNGVNN